MKAKALQLIGTILLALTIIYVALFKGEVNIEKSI